MITISTANITYMYYILFCRFISAFVKFDIKYASDADKLIEKKNKKLWKGKKLYVGLSQPTQQRTAAGDGMCNITFLSVFHSRHIFRSTGRGPAELLLSPCVHLSITLFIYLNSKTICTKLFFIFSIQHPK